MKNYLKNASVILMSMSMFISCSKNENDDIEAKSYDTTFKITDAPIDNADVKAVFVTVANVKVDNKELEGFSKTTFNLAALVNGNTKTLGNLMLESKSYSKIVLELDYDMDVNGNSPGCYVEMANGEKDKISASAKEIIINNSFDVLAMTSNEIIIDFDLRKTVKLEEGTETDFNFVTAAELTSGIRAVNKEVTGEIAGTANDANNTSDKIVVYAYKKGTFDANTETSGQGESKVTFANAVTSSEVNSTTGSYSLNFLKEGDYELVFASYKKDTSSKGFNFNAILEAQSTSNLSLGSISITSALQLNVNVTITGTRQ